MALAGQQGRKRMLRCAENYPKFLATLCPPSGILSEAENLLKIKDRKKRFWQNEAENILKTKSLPKTVGMQKLGDNLFLRAESCGGRKRLTFAWRPPFKISRSLRFSKRACDPSPAVLRPASSALGEGRSI